MTFLAPFGRYFDFFHDVMMYPISLQTLTLDGVTSFKLLKAALNTHVKARVTVQTCSTGNFNAMFKMSEY